MRNKLLRWSAIIIGAWLVGPYSPVHAAPLAGLVHANPTGYVGAMSGYGGARTWVRPLPDTAVLSCPAGTDAAACVWGNAAFAYRRFGDLPVDALVSVCAAAIEPGPFAPPNRPGVDPACGDPCGCGGALDRKTNVLKSAVVVTDVPVDTGTFTADKIAGVAPLTTTLAWDIKGGAISCVASGSWSGAKPLKGTQTITGLAANAKYTLTCTTAAVNGIAAASWVAPTQNTDNSPLTDLAGYRLVYGTAADALTQIIQIANPATLAYTVDSLAPGTWYFALRAYTTAGKESANSGVVSKVIAGTPPVTVTKSIDITVTPAPTVPNPPTGLTVVEKTAFRMDQPPNAPVLVTVGTVPVAITACTNEAVTAHAAIDRTGTVRTVNRVDRDAVVLTAGRTRPNVAYATCGA